MFRSKISPSKRVNVNNVNNVNNEIGKKQELISLYIFEGNWFWE